MNAIDRRDALKTILGSAAAIGLAATLLPGSSQAAPIALQKGLDIGAHPILQQVQSRRRRVCWWHRGRRVCAWRRWTCWWHRGRRVCGWR